MKAVYSLFVAALFAAGSVVIAFAQQPLPQGTPKSPCEQGTRVTDPEGEDAHILIATVSRVDHDQGLITLETDVGKLEMAAAPEEIADIQEGDVLIVYMTEEEESLQVSV